MGFLRRFACGCGTKSLPLESPKYESCVPAALSPMDDSPDDTWMPGRWACSSSPVDRMKKSKVVDGTCISEASTELPGAIMESPSSSINAVLPLGFNAELPHRELSSHMNRAQTAPPIARPRVTYFSDHRPVSSGLRRKPPPPLLLAGDSKHAVKVRESHFTVDESDMTVIQKPWSH
jgi:hypothetical protein